MKTKTKDNILLPIAVLAVASSVCSAQSYDPASDFSTTSNPGGVWSYGWSPTLAGFFNVDAFFTTSDYNFSGIDMWQGRQSGDYPPWVGHNSTVEPHSLGGTATMFPGDLALHPGVGGEFSILRWTAPAAGSFALTAAFSGIDIGPTTTDVHVLRNGVSLFNGDVSAFGPGPTYASILTIAAGDTIDFVVGYGEPTRHTSMTAQGFVRCWLRCQSQAVSRYWRSALQPWHFPQYGHIRDDRRDETTNAA